MNKSVKTHHDFADYIDILSTRYANGEITREEFEKQSEDLFRMDAVKTYLETMAESSKLSESKTITKRNDFKEEWRAFASTGDGKFMIGCAIFALLSALFSLPLFFF